MDFLNVSLVAVSGGSDSMALLHKLMNKKENLIVCHINYGIRESANRDQKIVEDFCRKNNIKLCVMKAIKYQKKFGNFENFARIIRYNFFKETYDKYGCDCLYIGHNMDDAIETYYIQKERNGKSDYFGIREDSFIYGMKIKRILLGETKEELRNYCISNNIEYGEDETNYDQKYLRNKIRHDVIAKMTLKEKKKIILEIKKMNFEKEKEYNFIHEVLSKTKKGNNILNVELFNSLTKEEKSGVIYYFIIEIIKKRISISEKRIEDIIRKLKTPKANAIITRFEEYILYKEYENIVLMKEKQQYSITIDRIEYKDYGEFSISDKGNDLEKVIISKDSLPLKIENYGGGDKRINRLFIEKKIPLSKRKFWPVVRDKLGNVLLVINLKKFYNINDSKNEKKIEIYINIKEKEKFNE